MEGILSHLSGGKEQWTDLTRELAGPSSPLDTLVNSVSF